MDIRYNFEKDLLSRTHFMEKAGTGINRVTDACIENGNKLSFDFSDSFWVIIKSNEIGGTNVVDDVTDNVTDNVTDSREARILELIDKNQNISIVQMARQLSVTKMTISRDIAKLKDQGQLKRVGTAKSGYWQVIKK